MLRRSSPLIRPSLRTAPPAALRLSSAMVAGFGGDGGDSEGIAVLSGEDQQLIVDPYDAVRRPIIAACRLPT